MIRLLRLLPACLLLLGSALGAEVQSDPPGAADRKPILDALRATDPMRELATTWKAAVVFDKISIRQLGDWAWLQASPTTSDGSHETEPVSGVLQKQKGHWTYVDFVSDEIAPAEDPDAAFRKWQKAFLSEHPVCPAGIFPPHF